VWRLGIGLVRGDSDRVARDYVPVRRDELMLLPPDVREWLAADHVVWFLLDAVAAMDTSALHRRSRLGGAGRCPYDPDMLLALLIYAYAGGLRSSRVIERRCREDVAFMVISGLCRPDHATIARFRKDNDAAMETLFGEVLTLCGRAGLGNLVHVAVDGTKVLADASRSQTRDVTGLRAVARRLLDEAAAVDEDEDARFGAARGDELPPELRDPQRRRQVIEELLNKAAADPDPRRGRSRVRKTEKADRALDLAEQIEADAARQADTQLVPLSAAVQRSQQRVARLWAAAQAKAQARAQREADAHARGEKVPGRPPRPVDEHVRIRKAEDVVKRMQQRLAHRRAELAVVTGKRNLTDPDSRFMPVMGGTFVLGYNCQFAVTADHLIIAVDVVADTGDVAQLIPMLAHVDQAVDRLRQASADPSLGVGVALFDAGYASVENLTAAGPDRLIALGKRDQVAGQKPPTRPPGPDATAIEQMAWRLNTPDGKALYKKRGATVEPVNGHVKDRRGLRRFARRGHTAALAEARLAALTTNLLRLFSTDTRAASPA
jgi:transposase